MQQEKTRMCTACGDEHPLSAFSKYGVICAGCKSARRAEAVARYTSNTKWHNLTEEQRQCRRDAIKRCKASTKVKKRKRFVPTNEQVTRIRSMSREWGAASALSKEFGCSVQTIYRIRDGKTHGGSDE